MHRIDEIDVEIKCLQHQICALKREQDNLIDEECKKEFSEDKWQFRANLKKATRAVNRWPSWKINLIR